MFTEILNNMENIYLAIAVGFTTFFVLQSALAIIGNLFESASDFDEDIDISIDEDIDISIDEDIDISFDEDIDFDEDISILSSAKVTFHLFTLRTIIGFFVLFGWSGYINTSGGVDPLIVFLTSILAGFLMMLLVAYVVHLLYKLEQTGTVNLSDSIGKEGTVYLKIPKYGQGTGKVQIVLGDSLRTLDALANDSEIETGKKVRIIDVKDKIIVVDEIE